VKMLLRRQLPGKFMIFGFQDISLIDYPGHIAPVVFVGGCNFRCPFCYNRDLVLNPHKNTPLIIDDVLARINKQKKLCEGVVITGGEPSLWVGKGLEKFLCEVKAMHLKVKLDTNGSIPANIKNLLQNELIDYIAMDIKTSFIKYNLAAGTSVDTGLINESIEVIKNSPIEHNFRTTCLPSLVDNEDIIAISKLLGKGERYTLQTFRPENTLKHDYNALKPYSPREMEGLKKTASNLGLIVEIT